MSGNLGAQPQGGPGAGGPPGRGRGPGAGGPPGGGRGPGNGPGAGGPPGGGRGPGAGGPSGGGPRAGGGGGRIGFGGPGAAMLGGGAPPSRWQVALYHTYRIQDEILIRPGVPVLDLLDVSAISSNGGASRHEIELSGGVFAKGMGFRLQGTYRAGTRIDGTGLPGSSTLTFGDQKNLTAFLFMDLDQQNWAKSLGVLKGSRLTLRVDNILNDIVDVRDRNGLAPLGYQPGFLDPRGRFFELSWRKRF